MLQVIARRFRSTVTESSPADVAKNLDMALKLSKTLDTNENHADIPLKGKTPQYMKEIDKLTDKPHVHHKKKPTKLDSQDKHKSTEKHSDKFSKKYNDNTSQQPYVYKSKADTLKLTSIEPETGVSMPPKLAHNLERVLFQPEVIHQLQDPRTGVFNFSPFLRDIIPKEHFDFDKVGKYITSSKDRVLSRLCKKHHKEFYSSTSSMTSVLSQLHFLQSNFKRLNIANLPKNMDTKMTAEYSHSAKLPAMVTVSKHENGCWSIDSDKSLDKSMVLSEMGHALEKLLTTSETDFAEFDKRVKGKGKKRDSHPESYHYGTIGNFLLRSQLDSYDHRLPGNGTFDLKTRAVCAIRHDLQYFEKNNNKTGYELKQHYGWLESFERELYDLCKTTLLKYSLQARIGKMDGIFVAYHNVNKMFGFQYLPLEVIDKIVHGPNGDSSKTAEREFSSSIYILDTILQQVIKTLPENTKQFRLVMHSAPGKMNPDTGKHTPATMMVYAAPLTKEQAAEFAKPLPAGSSVSPKMIESHVANVKALNATVAENLYAWEVSSLSGNHFKIRPFVKPSSKWYMSLVGQKSELLERQCSEEARGIVKEFRACSRDS